MYRKGYYASALSKPKGSNSVKLPLQHNRQFRSVEGIAPAVSFAEPRERDQLREQHLSPRSKGSQKTQGDPRLRGDDNVSPRKASCSVPSRNQ